MSLNLISLTSILCLFIVSCLANQRYENPVPLKIAEITDIVCDLTDIKEWKFNDELVEKGKKYSFSENLNILQIHKTDYDDEGNYTCITNAGSAKLYVAKAKPRFKITSSKGRIDVKSIHANEGIDIDMICYIPNKPEIPASERYDFVWLKGGKEASATLENARQHVLTISDITQQDRDTYSCLASNGVLNHTESIKLRVKDKISYIWPLIGILCEIVILVLIILIFEKRGVKPEFEESDNDGNTDV